MIAALLGVLHSGRAYVPLDPHYPEERLRFILEDSGAETLLTNGRNRELAGRLTGPLHTLVDLDEVSREGDEEGLPAPPAVPPGDGLAYLLYTSGSTGNPKGVMQSQRHVLRHAALYGQSLGLRPEDRLTLLSSYAFDAAVMAIYGALLHGATLCPFDVRAHGTAGMAAWIREGGVTVYHSTPTLFRTFFDSLAAEEVLPLRWVVLGGEEVRPRDVATFLAHTPPEAAFLNGLGPTESTLALQNRLLDRRVPERATVPVGLSLIHI